MLIMITAGVKEKAPTSWYLRPIHHARDTHLIFHKTQNVHSQIMPGGSFLEIALARIGIPHRDFLEVFESSRDQDIR